MKRFRRFVMGISMGLVAAAVYQELQKPPEERTWHGRVARVVPYDFRMPTPVMGVGWAVNFYRLLQVLSELIARLQTAIREHA
jgi:hypothetical protein